MTSVDASNVEPICVACNDYIQHHYKDGCSVSDCTCTWTFGSTTYPEDNKPLQCKEVE